MPGGKNRIFKRKAERLLFLAKKNLKVDELIHLAASSENNLPISEQHNQHATVSDDERLSRFSYEAESHGASSDFVLNAEGDCEDEFSFGEESHGASSDVFLNEDDYSDDEFASEGEILSSDEEFTEEDDEVEPSMNEKLREWAVKYQVNQNAVSSLLKILKPSHPELPTDCHTLLKTARKTNIVDINNGQYCYYGIEHNLQKLNLFQICADKTVRLRINIDGLPLYKSSGKQLWPILGLIVSTESVVPEPFTIACFCGAGKPSTEDFLRDFVSEAASLVESGFVHKFVHFSFEVASFNCDAPARAFIKCIKNHNAYYGCEKCIQKGIAVQGHVKFLEMESSLRTDIDFAHHTEVLHHSDPVIQSPLLGIPNLGLVSQFPLDTMHLVDLGVTRKLLLYWTRNGEKKKENSTKLSSTQVSTISYKMISFQGVFPSEFSRQPRSLKEIDRWKATEFRQFLLYLAPVVLKNVLPDAIYTHFLCYHAAMSVLSNPKYCNQEQYLGFAENMLKSFVEDMQYYYGKKSLVYNVHSLLHICNDVRKFGPVEAYSCYPFENYLGKMKRSLRMNARPLAQISKRLSEIDSASPLDPKGRIVFLHKKGSYSTNLCQGEEFSDVLINDTRISSTNMRDGTVHLKNNKFASILNIVKTESGGCKIIYREIKCSGYYFTDPCESSVSSMFKVDSLQDKLEICNIKCKKYAVVSFINEDKVEIVPSKWLLSETLCRWPENLSTTSLTRIIRECGDSQDSWRTVKIHIYGKTNSFKTANIKANLAQDTSHIGSDSSAEESDDAPEFQGKRKRVPKKTDSFHFYASQAMSSDDEIEKLTPAPTHKKRFNIPSFPSSDSLMHKKSGLNASSSSVFARSSDLGNEVQFTPNMQREMTSTPKSHVSQTAEPRQSSTPTSHVSQTAEPRLKDSVLKEIFAKIQAVEHKCDDLSKKIDEVLLRLSAEQPKGSSLLFQSLPEGIQLPITSDEELIALNSRLEDKTVSAALVRYLYVAASGRTCRAFMQSILKRSISKDVAIKYSRYGRKGKKNFSLMENCVNVFLATATMKYPDVGREDIGELFGKSLASANDWDGRTTRPSDVSSEKDASKNTDNDIL